MDLLSIPREFWFLLAVLAIAVLGKYVGSYLSLTYAGLKRMDKTVTSVGMNGRGAMQLILVSVGGRLRHPYQTDGFHPDIACVHHNIRHTIAFRYFLRHYQKKGLYKR